MAKFKNVKMTRKLILDCKARWNSTFMILEAALPYRVVFEHANQVEKQHEHLPSVKEWEIGLFYEITKLFSRTD